MMVGMKYHFLFYEIVAEFKDAHNWQWMRDYTTGKLKSRRKKRRIEKALGANRY